MSTNFQKTLRTLARGTSKSNRVRPQQNFADWHVKGIISCQTFDKHYQVTLDLEKGPQTKTLQLLLRRFSFAAAIDSSSLIDPPRLETGVRLAICNSLSLATVSIVE